MDPTARDLFPDFTVVERLDTSREVLDHAGIVLAQGRHSWYSGHYHRESFAGRARYLFADSPTYRGVPTDKLVIGNFCQFASGTTFLLGGNQGHDMDAVTPYGFNFVDRTRLASPWNYTQLGLGFIVNSPEWTGGQK